MDISVMFILILILLLFIVLFPECIPYCQNCKRLKFRFFFKIHISESIRSGYAGTKSICKKCCKKYNLNTLSEYKQIEKIRKKLQIDAASDRIEH